LQGLGGIIASQILPFGKSTVTVTTPLRHRQTADRSVWQYAGDPKILGLWAQVEAGLIQNLQ
jgi:hypothetical protein